ncbi:MAG: oxygen-independent coproporphyrinogen III oxidase [Clostridia bacterium]|nr:oxygen-independent coproporphyrinogen III oxidase [Clostridia bacterium]
MERFGIYVHIPFCKKKCKYCDFISFASYEEKYKEYVDCLIKEIRNKKIEKTKTVTTIYLGGGTPSILESEDIVKILNAIKERFEIEENCEITIEVNPGTITRQKLEDYKNAGVNRLSIGLQSTSDRILKFIGRIHTYEEFLNTYNLAKEVGFENINVDLMLAIPTQTENELIDSVQKVIDLEPNHISLYSLILEEGTELDKMVSDGQYELLDENLERQMYWETKNLLESNGYNHYEISNFSKKGFESKHNMDCWNQENYIGFGLAAHSYYDDMRFSNIDALEVYMRNIKNNDFEKNVEIHEIQDKPAQMREFMMIGLRKIEGVKISDFERKFRINPLFYFRFEISKLTDEDLIEVDLDNIKLTKKGLDLANQVFEEFV